MAASLENVVYLESCRRGYTVQIGKTADGEIELVATRQNEKLYIQVTQEINSEKTILPIFAEQRLLIDNSST